MKPILTFCNTVLFLAATTGTFLMSSCKKDNSSTSSGSSSLPKTYTEIVRNSIIGNSSTTYDLTYDSKNRLIGVTSIPAPPVLNFVYAYPSSSSYTMDLYENGSLSIHEIFYLNNLSKVDSTFQYDDSQDTTTEKYIYDANKLLVQLKTYDYSSGIATLSSTANNTFDANGNATLSVDDQGNTTVNTFYTDQPNSLTLGQTFLPQNTNLLKTTTLTTSSYTETATHYYTFDSNNRVIQDSAVISGYVVATGIKNYTY
jgi:hypothetical protein